MTSLELPPDLSPADAALAKRILDRVRVEGEHWIWLGSLSHCSAPRLAWREGKRCFFRNARHEIVRIWRSADNASLVRSTCSEPLCVAPAHLAAMTRAQLQEELSDAGIIARGERVHGAKLTEDDVLAIRSLRLSGDTDFQLQARAYGVCAATIRYAYVRKTWKHVA